MDDTRGVPGEQLVIGTQILDFETFRVTMMASSQAFSCTHKVALRPSSSLVPDLLPAQTCGMRGVAKDAHSYGCRMMAALLGPSQGRRLVACVA